MPTLGLFATNMGVCATADGAARIGPLAEELGYDSLWMGEHVVAPRPWAAGVRDGASDTWSPR
jgi:alkanesulfonate monooxygenase SsuD/methylene tetrahydromethanopterin reductase-like flavin-dependent oxidoreductase (luciferase family)